MAGTAACEAARTWTSAASARLLPPAACKLRVSTSLGGGDWRVSLPPLDGLLGHCAPGCLLLADRVSFCPTEMPPLTPWPPLDEVASAAKGKRPSWPSMV